MTAQRIKVTFSKGSFEEWAGGNGDSYPPAFIKAWEGNYNRVLARKIQAAFPQATVEVGEGYDQIMYPKIDADDETIESEVKAMLDMSQAELDEVWATPHLDTVVNGIEEILENNPIGKLEYGLTTFAFAQHKESGWVWRFDLAYGDPLDPDNHDWWQAEAIEAAARLFLDEVE